MTKEITLVKIAEEKSERKCRPIEDINNLLDKDALHHTLEAIYDLPKPGKPEANCHNTSMALMTDLMINGLSAGYKLITTKKMGNRRWDHSWLECEDWAIDASGFIKNPDMPEGEYYIYFWDALDYRKFLGVRKFHIKRQFIDKEFAIWIKKYNESIEGKNNGDLS